MQRNAPILECPTKASTDKKEYRVIKLKNGLTALLISDPRKIVLNDGFPTRSSNLESCSEGESDDDGEVENGDEDEEMEMNEDEDKARKFKNDEQYLAAASLCIGVGSFSDPEDIQGLMHFLEHMVFMGSKKYPTENHFDQFISRRGGQDNAHTDMENTTFYFEVQEKHFKDALDIFANFFISPLLKKEAMDRERKAVHSEFELSLHNDSCRAEQLFASCAIEGHPMSRFTFGNDITLFEEVDQEELHKRVLQAWKSYYSAQFMTLAVQSRNTLDELEEWTTEIFSQVQNNDLPRPTYLQLSFPFPVDRLHQLQMVVPVKDYHLLHIVWPLPTQMHLYKSKPVGYLAHLFGYEGSGSILALLRERALAVDLSAGHDGSGFDDNSTCCLFSIDVELSNEGFENREEVLMYIFQYLKMLKSTPVCERLFKEMQQIESINFEYGEESKPINNVEHLCESMQLYPPQHYITGSSLIFEFDDQAITSILEHMTPSNCLVSITSKEFDKDGICDSTEKWFGTSYCKRDIPRLWEEKWISAPLCNSFYLPEANPFIPTDFSICPKPVPQVLYPEQLISDSSGQLWFKQDTKFCLPRTYCQIQVTLHFLNEGPHIGAMLDLYLKLLCQHITVPLYPAAMAQYSYSIKANESGFVISISGFNQKLLKVLEVILKEMKQFESELKDKTFDAFLQQQMKGYHNVLLKPGNIRIDVRLYLLQEFHWQIAAKLKACKVITKDNLIKNFVNRIFEEGNLQMLIQGNLVASDAKEIYKCLSSNFKCKIKPDLPQMHCRELPSGTTCLRLQNINPCDVNTSVISYFQAEEGTIWNELINEFVQMIMEEPVFNELRTQKQLGYNVYCTNRNTYGVLGLSITVNTMADKFTADEVDTCIEECLVNFASLVRNLSDEDFLALKETLMSTKKVVDVTLKEEVARNWGEVKQGEYYFGRLEKHIELIPSITKEAILNWLLHVVNGDQNKVKKLTVQVVGATSPTKEGCPSLQDTLDYSDDKLWCFIPAQGRGNYITNLNDLQELRKSMKVFKENKITQ